MLDILSEIVRARGVGLYYAGDPPYPSTSEDYARVRWYAEPECKTPLPTDQIPTWKEISALASSLAVARLWTDLRERRNALLSQSDWTQMSDSPLSAEDRAIWVAYRKSLRDLPTTTTDPASPTWPTPPE